MGRDEDKRLKRSPKKKGEQSFFCMYIYILSDLAGTCIGVIDSLSLCCRQDRRSFPDPFFIEGIADKSQRTTIHNFFKKPLFEGIDTVTITNKESDSIQPAAIKVDYCPTMVCLPPLLLMTSQDRCCCLGSRGTDNMQLLPFFGDIKYMPCNFTGIVARCLDTSLTFASHSDRLCAH